MRIGSLVECIDTVKVSDLRSELHFIKEVPVIGKDYIVSEIGTCACCGEPMLSLEGVNPGSFPNDPELFHDAGNPVMFPISWFKELQLPPSMSQDISEALTRELFKV